MDGISEQSPRRDRRDGFLYVPTLTFGVLYCFFVIAHDRRRILHFNVTKHPDSAWVIQQLREAFPYDSAPGYLIFDRAVNFNGEVVSTMKSFVSSQRGRVSEVRGRMASQNAGLGVADAICSTM